MYVNSNKRGESVDPVWAVNIVTRKEPPNYITAKLIMSVYLPFSQHGSKTLKETWRHMIFPEIFFVVIDSLWRADEIHALLDIICDLRISFIPAGIATTVIMTTWYFLRQRVALCDVSN